MTRQSFETAATLLLDEGDSFVVHTTAEKNLGLNGREPITFEVGRKSVCDSYHNYYVETDFEILGDNLIRLDIFRRTWITDDINRKHEPCKTFSNTVFLDVASITHLTKN